MCHYHTEKKPLTGSVSEKIISNNWPCFRSENFHSFCDQLNCCCCLTDSEEHKWHWYHQSPDNILWYSSEQHFTITSQALLLQANQQPSQYGWLQLHWLISKSLNLVKSAQRISSLWRGQLHLPAKPTHLVHCKRIPDQIHTGSSMTRPTEGLHKISAISSSVTLLFHSSNPKCTL